MSVNASSGTFGPSSTTFTETYYGQANGTATKSGWSSYSGSSAVGSDTPGFYRMQRLKMLLPVTHWDQRFVEGSNSGSRQYGYYASNVLKTTYSQPQANQNNWPGDTVNISANEAEGCISPSALDAVVSGAVDKCLSSSHDTGTFAAELGKTLGMFRGAIMRLATILSSSKNATQGYLEMRYGWRPLLFDLQSIDEAIANLGNRSPFTRAVSSISESYDLSSSTTFAVNPIAGYLTNQCTKTVEVSYRGFATSKGPRNSFGVNPVVTAWELVRFSFVVDWFYDIGSKLRYLCNLVLGGRDFVSGTGQLVVGNCESSTTISTASSPATGYRWISNTANATSSVKLILRQPRSPSITPYFRPRVSGLQVLDLLALLAQVLSKRP